MTITKFTPTRPTHSSINTLVKLEQMKNNARKWIIIEDDVDKASLLIANILEQFPKEDISWIYTESTDSDYPSYIEKNNGKTIFRDDVKLNVDGEYKFFEKEIGFVFGIDRAHFFEVLKSLDFTDSVILLDIKQPVLDNSPEIDTQLKDYLLNVLSEYNDSITIVSNKAHYASTKKSFYPLEKRINIQGSGDWEFAGKKMYEDCQAAVRSAAKFHQRTFSENTYQLEDFLSDMAKLDQHACHNWRENDYTSLKKYKQKGRWNLEWDMPIQLGYLIKLLDYQPQEFITTFNLKKNGYFYEGHPIGECLKVMGTKVQSNEDEQLDKTKVGTNSFSFMGALFICWAAYRNTFRSTEERKDKYFIKAIKSSFKDIRYIPRSSAISPPQQYETLTKTVNTLYDVMIDLYKSTNLKNQGKDNLKGVRLNREGLSIRLNISPSKFHEKMRNKYQYQMFGKSASNEGSTTQKILELFKLTNYCDRLDNNNKHLLGFTNSLKILSAGDREENGIILKLGT